jgi:CheY-like chemotaxis protein
MLSLNKYTEHNKIDNFLRRRSIQIQQTREVINHENKLSNFPIGLIIITKEEQPLYQEKIEFINYYACQLFQLKENTNIRELKSKFEEYARLKDNNATKTNCTLNDLIFDSPAFSFEIENFFPFQSKHSKNIILYIKINNIQNQKYIVIDKYDKYIEEQKYIEFNLIKNINYQYLHTLYHELNNPLNALLALSGENHHFETSENNSKNNNKPILMKKKTIKTIKTNIKKQYKKEKKQCGAISLDNIKNRDDNSNNEYKQRRKSIYDYNSSEVSSKINLLVKIIKIFIKNFILYLKTRADNLLSLKNEFKIQNETSDLINAVEVSDYEQDLTKHKSVKINLEYILDLYLNKYHCLFKYKEIEYYTNFTELRNIFVVTDDFNFSYYIRQIYTYLYYVVPKKEGFYFENKFKDNNKKVEITIKKKFNGTLSKTTDEPCDLAMNQIIQTKEMTKEVLYGMTKKLGFEIKIFDNDDKEQNNYLSIILPIIKKDKLTEDDEFKDDDINEKIGKNYLLLDEKLKRQFPSFGGVERKNSNVSTIHMVDMLSKNGYEKKNTSESFLSFPKNINFKNENNICNDNSIINSNNIGNNCNNLVTNENQKKYIPLNSNASCDSFLNKCLKISYNKRTEKSRFKKNSLNIKLIKNRIKNHSGKNIFINITNINNSPKKPNYNDKSFVTVKKIINKNNGKLFKNKGIFTLINNCGLTEEMDFYDNDNISNISNTTQKNIKNKKNQIAIKGQNSVPSIKIKLQKINNGKNKNKRDSNKSNNYHSQFDLGRRISEDKNSTSVKTCFFGNKNAAKSNCKTSCLISEINGENEEKNKNNININKNVVLKDLTKLGKVGVKIEYVQDVEKKENTKLLNLKKDFLSEIKEEPDQKRKFSQNINPPARNSKEVMTFFDKKKLNISKDNNTMIDDSINENKNLFIEASEEKKSILEKSKNIKTSMSKSSEINVDIEEDEKEDVENEENEEDNENNESIEESNEKKENNEYEESPMPSEEKCNCADLLVVDDEEFNVMASQRMLKKLGYLSDKAYNGQECIDLINEKKNSNCKCGKNYYQIIFLDIVMPVMDGIKAAHKVQEMIENKEINEEVKIVFISGNIDGADLEKSLLEIKCVKECLQKPVMIAKYQKILEKYYNKN